MKGSRREKEFSSEKFKKKKRKKHKRKYDSSSSKDSESSGDEMKWVEASPPQNSTRKVEKKKKKSKNRKHRKSSPSDTDSSDSEIKKVDSPSENSTVQKNKKSKKRKYRKSSPSDTESSDSEIIKVESPSANLPLQRESWMNEESFVPTLTKDEMTSGLSSRQRRADLLREQQEREEKIQNQRELNPYWKNDGTGLPEKEADVENLSLPSTSVGDGGYSWLKKAYYRIQEQAQQQGRSMEEIAVERWGSLNKLVSLIEEAETRMNKHPDHKRYFPRDLQKRDYQRSNAVRFRKPSEVESGRSFDSPYEYQKPSGDREHHGKVNQFKSSRKSTYYDYEDRERRDSSLSADSKISERKRPNDFEKLEHRTQKMPDKEKRIPAWMKPKHAEQKIQDIEMKSEPVSEASIKEVADLDDMPSIFSEEDLNQLAARQIKAEILGDAALAKKLSQQLHEARLNIKENGFAKRPLKQVDVILTKLDSQGQSRPIPTTQDKISDYKQKKTNKYFDDGSKYSLKQMFEREKLTTADDQMEMFVEASVKCDDSAEIDFELGNVSKKLSQKLATGREEEKDIGKAIRHHQKLNAALEKCNYCLDQPRMKKHLIVDIGDQVYLCLPNYQIMTEGHCLVVPKTHVSSFLTLDEDVWREVSVFKCHLRNLFRSQNKSVVFLETSMNFKYHPHAVLECIPVPEEEGHMAPFYFKKAIQESEAEWAHNKKLIDLKGKGLRHSIPKNLPYFHVEFDPKVHAGYAHVIEDEKYFPHNFGKEVVGGMLDIDYHYLYKNKKEDPLQKSKEVVEFQKAWKKFKEDT